MSAAWLVSEEALQLIAAYFNGFAISLALILAIGAQNAFVLRQGLLKQYIFPVVMFCALSDAVLILTGVSGVAFLLADFVQQHSKLIYGLATIWLAGYGCLRLRSAFLANGILAADGHTKHLFSATMIQVAILTFMNPHVYLDTVLLIGTVSIHFEGVNKLSFVVGAISASFLFFFALGYGATFFAPKMKTRKAWAVLDCLVATVMFVLAVSMARAGELI